MIAAGVGLIVLSASLIPAGIVGVIFTPSVGADIVTANLEMPEGTPARRTAEIATQVEAAGRRAIERLSRNRHDDAEPLLLGVNFAVGAKSRPLGGAIAQEPQQQPRSNIAAVEFKLLDAERRDVDAEDFQRAWREEAGVVPEARALYFTADVLDLGAPVQVEFSHPDQDRLGLIGETVVEALRGFEGVFDVQSDHDAGLGEVRIELKPEARTLGLTVANLAQQVRSAFFGNEALRGATRP